MKRLVFILVCAFSFYGCFRLAVADITVLFKITKFRVSLLKGHNRVTHTTECCDGSKSGCQGPCSPIFHLCITESNTATKCLAEKITTAVSVPAVQYNFSETIGTTPNPFVFRLKSFGWQYRIHVIAIDSQHGHNLTLLDYNFGPYVFRVPDTEPKDWSKTHKTDYVIGSRIEFEYKIFHSVVTSTTVSTTSTSTVSTTSTSTVSIISTSAVSTTSTTVSSKAWSFRTTTISSLTPATTGVSCSCINGGTCTNSNGKKTCKCPGGLGGDNCETSCTCFNNGTCIFIPGGYSCSCPKYYTGRQCEHDLCYNNQCPKEATCVVSHGFARCICPTGLHPNYDFTVCIDRDECRAPPAIGYCVHGHCSNFHGGYNCTCNAGWTGKTCSDNIDECQSNPCQNSGSCYDTVGSFSCLCPKGFIGHLCEFDEDECRHMPCRNNGTCHNSLGSFRCSCILGYTGMNCEMDVDECQNSPCGQHATCSNIQGSYTCFCDIGYTGLHCDQTIDECKSNPCQNNGLCIVHANRFDCQCSHGFNGTLCENDINECVSNPCQNSGICRNTIGSHVCTCKPGFTGETCEQDINECSQSPCKSNGTCVNSFGSYTCFCETGIGLFNCDHIPTVTCRNHGTLTRTSSGYSFCKCLAGYDGTFCELKITKCSSNPCFNGGSCEDLPDDFNCYCLFGFHGERCEIDVDECADHQRCDSREICVNTLGSYHCVCPSYGTGTNCETTIGTTTKKTLFSHLLRSSNQQFNPTTSLAMSCSDSAGFPCNFASGFCNDEHIALSYCRKTCGRCDLPRQGNVFIGR